MGHPQQQVAVLPSPSAAQSPQGAMEDAGNDQPNVDAYMEGGEQCELVAQGMASTGWPPTAPPAWLGSAVGSGSAPLWGCEEFQVQVLVLVVVFVVAVAVVAVVVVVVVLKSE